jgi:F0F1-type ATP synthase membrane subunit a
LRITYETGAISIGSAIGIIILIIVIVCLVLLWQKRKVSQVVARVSIALQRSNTALRNSFRKRMGLPPVEV